jgi:hypothetical protein
MIKLYPLATALRNLIIRSGGEPVSRRREPVRATSITVSSGSSIGGSGFSGGGPGLEAARFQVREIISNLRSPDGRPSQTGKIPGLTREMELLFQSGRVSVGKVLDQYIIFDVKIPGGGTEIGKVGWDKVGCSSANPLDEEKQRAVEIYEAWVRAEVGFETGDTEIARDLFARHFPKIQLTNSAEHGLVSAGQTYFVMALLELFSSYITDSEKIRKFDVNGKALGHQVVGYEPNRCELTIINSSNWDRYLFAIAVLRGAGLASYEMLDIHDRGELSSLFRRFAEKNAFIGTSLWGVSTDHSLRSQHTPQGFLAEKIMLYLVFGDRMAAGTGEVGSLRKAIYYFIKNKVGIPELKV